MDTNVKDAIVTNDWHGWLENYFQRYTSEAFDEKHYPALIAFRDLCLKIRASKNKLLFAGNGASASISSHGAVDFTKQGRVRAVDFNEPNLITCFANDYGYENWIWRAMERYADPGDAVVLISVSGTSPNAVKAAEWARRNDVSVVTFTGKSPENPLKAQGDINFHIPSGAYNVVEGVHNIWLTTVVDMLVGEAEYSVI
ncbi:SIS domain-containing protein [Roseomonas gilardii]|uniref:SIS domain-containing protein n=1 Tax=Roseomonas gilardii TaxID=257708 RepID=A0ABU3MCB8_9PROT|nr:SIS domain-containing protein [Roseomonas gilardii]MDT8330548.1 SIS domain-containing protein [Roseomonas gilardii]